MTAAAYAAIPAYCVALGAIGMAAVRDVRHRIIPDKYVLAVAGAGLVLRVLDLDASRLALSLSIAIVTLVVLGQLSRFNIIGGGDAKLIAAATLLQPPAALPLTLALIALWGGALGIVYLLKSRAVLLHARLAGRSPAHALVPESLPYGVAILLGTLSSNLLEVTRQCSTVASCWS